MRVLKQFRLAILAIIVALFRVAWAWDPDMPGGMKLVIDGETYSFTTEVCSGGVFFSRPVHIQLICLHGYFLIRPNGCYMEGNDIIGGENYVCHSANKDKGKLIQAFIPATNPTHPLAHTITLFDDPDTLKDFRRLTYVKGLEGRYESFKSAPAGAIVTNSMKTPELTIGNVCYQGLSQKTGEAYIAKLPRNNQPAQEYNMFTLGCQNNTVEFQWGAESVHNFTEGYSDPGLFDSEIRASLLNEDGKSSLINRKKIWGGMAYCLQANEKILDNGKIQMNGIEPSIESLGQYCPKRSAALQVPGHPRKRQNVLIRKIRSEIVTSVEFNSLMTCMATCWKDGTDKCHKKPAQVTLLPYCPPYCGGKITKEAPTLEDFRPLVETTVPPVAETPVVVAVVSSHEIIVDEPADGHPLAEDLAKVGAVSAVSVKEDSPAILTGSNAESETENVPEPPVSIEEIEDSVPITEEIKDIITKYGPQIQARLPEIIAHWPEISANFPRIPSYYGPAAANVLDALSQTRVSMKDITASIPEGWRKDASVFAQDLLDSSVIPDDIKGIVKKYGSEIEARLPEIVMHWREIADILPKVPSSYVSAAANALQGFRSRRTSRREFQPQIRPMMRHSRKIHRGPVRM